MLKYLDQLGLVQSRFVYKFYDWNPEFRYMFDVMLFARAQFSDIHRSVSFQSYARSELHSQRLSNIKCLRKVKQLTICFSPHSQLVEIHCWEWSSITGDLIWFFDFYLRHHFVSSVEVFSALILPDTFELVLTLFASHYVNIGILWIFLLCSNAWPLIASPYSFGKLILPYIVYIYIYIKLMLIKLCLLEKFN